MFVVVDVGSVLGEFSDKLQSFFFTETLEFSVFSSFSFSNRRLLEKRRPVIGKRSPWRPRSSRPESIYSIQSNGLVKIINSVSYKRITKIYHSNSVKAYRNTVLKIFGSFYKKLICCSIGKFVLEKMKWKEEWKILVKIVR